ncbi:hypothetical protein LX32DRAFT_371504 [Colletotrichum zoysiae]|uniref:Uncharacterized protein n=1 Tax=Colletotrichum zoysiae TaxID=1216348 RepID=A0AAD9M7A0_9PEZI|nr:hypothetical protein LX32DRAFT_371504 [Colletotrichum zoysiae]
METSIVGIAQQYLGFGLRGWSSLARQPSLALCTAAVLVPLPCMLSVACGGPYQGCIRTSELTDVQGHFCSRGAVNPHSIQNWGNARRLRYPRTIHPKSSLSSFSASTAYTENRRHATVTRRRGD